MLAERASFVVFFRGKHMMNKINELPVDVAYQSDKSNYVVIYADKKEEENLRKQLKKIKGYKGFAPSYLYDETRNF
ncbi:DUF2129 domain-containing protein [Mycoplasmatota bacterium]|nr:DUF2129 domain-containing protein [Mycoplasmatota bacterium]